jgi:predicted DNA-binding transcriptional regulator YafY
MTLRVIHLTDARNAVLRWGDHVEALEPPELRAELIAALDAARARYTRT